MSTLFVVIIGFFAVAALIGFFLGSFLGMVATFPRFTRYLSGACFFFVGLMALVSSGTGPRQSDASVVGLLIMLIGVAIIIWPYLKVCTELKQNGGVRQNRKEVPVVQRRDPFVLGRHTSGNDAARNTK